MRTWLAAVLVILCATSVAQAQRLEVGSLGRVAAGVDHEGGSSRSSGVASFGPRLDQGDFFLLDVRGRPGIDVDVVSSLAVYGSPFQRRRGEALEAELINLYAQARELVEGLEVWAGARSLLGPGVYLYELYPVRNLALVGGGASYSLGTLRFDAQLGVADRRAPALPLGQRTNIERETFVGDRPRMVGAASFGQRLSNLYWAIFGELQLLAKGPAIPPDATPSEPTSNRGLALGAALTTDRLGVRDGHIGVSVRGATGIAALSTATGRCVYDGLSDASAAKDVLVAFSANYERGAFGAQVGGYAHQLDGTGALCPVSSVTEGGIAVRPHWYATATAGIATELGYELARVGGVPDDGLATVERIAILPFITPTGQGSYRRPLLYANYTAAHRNEAAQAQYALADVRARRGWDHRFTIGVEWWFDSTLGYGARR